MRVFHLMGALLVLGAIAQRAEGQATAAAPAAPAAARPKPGPLPADSMQRAQKFTAWFYAGQTDSLIAYSVPSGRSAEQMRNDILGDLKELTSRAGKEVWVLEEKFITRNGRRQYWRTAKFSQFDEPILVRFVIDEKGMITGFGLGPQSAAPPVDPD